MGVYRKKPVEIEIRVWDGTPEGATPIIDWILDNGRTARWHGPIPGDPDCPTPMYHETHHYCPGCSFSDEEPKIRIDTLEGVMSAEPGAGIAKGVKGEFYPIRADILAETYEKVSD